MKTSQSIDSKEPTEESVVANFQADLHGETIQEYLTASVTRGKARMYADHDALMKTEKHIWRYNRNPEKNRNPASVCYNENSVELGYINKKEEKLDRGHTYINANYLKSQYGNFILAQAPMANTLIDWFRMIWQEKVAIIVCLIDPQNTSVCERYFKTSRGSTLKIKGRFRVRTVSVREDTSGIQNYELQLINKLASQRDRTLYVVAMPTQLNEPVSARKQLNLLAEVWATATTITSLTDEHVPAPILVHGCNGVSRTAAFVATSMLCKSLQTTGEMSPTEVWALLNNARHNAAKERVHFLSSIECALLYAVDIGLIPSSSPQLAQVNKMIRSSYDEERGKTRHPSASRE